MRDLFIGSEALAAGRLTRAELRRGYTRLLPDVYGPKTISPTLRVFTTAAWLWSHRQGVVAGQAAAAMHRAKWVDDRPIEMIWPNHRAPAGVLTRNDTLLPGEWETVAGLPVTTPTRTAFDLARRGAESVALARLDALARATPISAGAVRAMAEQHRRARGLTQLDKLIDLIDVGAASPKESWLRLLLINAGFPRPVTQIPVLSPGGRPRYYLDMGWPEVMVSVEYDGEHHRVDRVQYARDLERSDYIAHVGWLNIRVIGTHPEARIVRRVNDAWVMRGYGPGTNRRAIGNHFCRSSEVS